MKEINTNIKNINVKNKNFKSKEEKSSTNYSLSIKIIIALFVLLMIFLIVYKIKNNNNADLKQQQQINDWFSMYTSSTYAEVSKYIVYGTHFNIEGTLEYTKVSGISIKNVSLIAKNLNSPELIIDSTYNYSDNIISFSTIDKINSGLDLESLKNSNYYLALKVSLTNGDTNYYSLINKTEYPSVTYYSLTKNNTNNKIDIKFDTYNQIPYMCFLISTINALPNDVYDVVIDPGHGGADSGAVYKDYKESSIVLDCAKNLKSNLEDLGLKVLLTRDGSEDNSYKESNTYEDNGRVTVANESHAKISLSLHLNSNTDVKSGGIEVYSPSNCDLTLASLLASNISTYTGANYSSRKSFKQSDGVYVQNFTNADILAFETKAKKQGYEPYKLTKSTPYLYMIREIGGIATNAFVDGRNTNYGANKYYKSNIGIEGYLIELGYMKVSSDLENILSNSNKYMLGISDAIKTFYEL